MVFRKVLHKKTPKYIRGLEITTVPMPYNNKAGYYYRSVSSLIQTILSVLDFHQISRFVHLPKTGRGLIALSKSPPVGNCTLPRRTFLIVRIITHIHALDNTHLKKMTSKMLSIILFILLYPDYPANLLLQNQEQNPLRNRNLPQSHIPQSMVYFL